MCYDKSQIYRGFFFYIYSTNISMEKMKYLILLLLLFTSCSKPTGSEIEILTRDFQITWEEATVNGNTASNSVDLPELTAEIIGTGVVNVTVNIDGKWYPLPYTMSYDINQSLNVDQTVELTYSLSPGTLTIYHISSYNNFFQSDFIEGRYRVKVLY